MAVTQYYQCRLQLNGRETTGWIEARGAKVGAVIELLPSGEWWDVVEVYKHGLPEDVLKAHQRMHRGSLPSVKRMGG